MPMGITAENVSARYGVNRNDMDVFAAESHKSARLRRQREIR